MTTSRHTGFARKAVRLVTAALLIAAAASFLAVGVSVRTGNLHLQAVLSGSMRPGTQPGDMIATWKVPTSSLKPGDVIVFYPPGYNKAEMHRIVTIHRLNNGTYQVATKGDANNKVDSWSPVTIRGDSAYRRVAVMPGLGWVPVWAHHFPGNSLRSVLLILSGLLFGWVAVAKALSGRSRKESQTDQTDQPAMQGSR